MLADLARFPDLLPTAAVHGDRIEMTLGPPSRLTSRDDKVRAVRNMTAMSTVIAELLARSGVTTPLPSCSGNPRGSAVNRPSRSESS